MYFLVQASAVLILVLAANTAYADFPRLASLLARDNYAPHQLAFAAIGWRSRMALSCSACSALLIVVFGGSRGALLPLYALSVFTRIHVLAIWHGAPLAARTRCSLA
jgi:hypothetical protein